MARARLLKPGFFTNEHLAELPFEGRLLFAGLWTLADREGRLEDRPKRIQAELFPWDAVDVDKLLVALENKGFIERYSAGAMALIQIAKFLDHQTPHPKEAKSGLPCNSTACNGNSGTSPSVLIAVPIAVSKTVESAEPLPRSAPTFAEFPVVGSKSTSWQLSEALVAEWATMYPNLAVHSELRKALAWLNANPGRRKTARGMPAFLVNWLNRATDDRRNGERRAEVRGSSDRRVGGMTFDCPHEPHCRTTGQCVQLSRVSA